MDCILVVNVGSSTLKFAIFQTNKNLIKICSGRVDNKKHILSLYNEKAKSTEYKIHKGAHSLLEPKELFKLIKAHYPNVNIKAVGNRIVHGGKNFLHPVLITKSVIKKLKALIPLAPLHMPSEISFAEKILQDFPKLHGIACFDTSFHRTLPRLATVFAIPRKYINQDGIMRYGFHGLSYEYIANELPKYAKKTRSNKVIIAHLGNGASMCAIYKGKSIATSMGFTTLDGLMMGTRCGSIDPGILIYLMEEKGLSMKEIKQILYKESGLLGISNITGDAKKLIASHDPKAKEALDLFCYRAVQELGSLIATLEGLDILVFTGGIGEHAAIIRKKICNHLKWLGLKLSHNKNERNAHIITTSTSKIKVCIIPTNEELMIAKRAFSFIK